MDEATYLMCHAKPIELWPYATTAATKYLMQLLLKPPIGISQTELTKLRLNDSAVIMSMTAAIIPEYVIHEQVFADNRVI